MLNRTLILIVALISGIALSSCSSHYSLTKRRYTKGYHYSVVKNKKAAKSKLAEGASETVAKVAADKNQQIPEQLPTQIKSSVTEIASNKTTHSLPKKDRTTKYVLTAASVKKVNTHTQLHLHRAFDKVNRMEKSDAQSGHKISEAPYQFFGNGTGLLAFIVGAFISILVSFLFFFLLFAIVDGLFPVWLLSFLIFLLVIAVIAIIVIVVINSD